MIPFLDKLISFVIKPDSNVPEDAQILARYDLILLNKQIETALENNKLDIETRAYLDETKSRIDAALKANVLRQLESSSSNKS